MTISVLKFKTFGRAQFYLIFFLNCCKCSRNLCSKKVPEKFQVSKTFRKSSILFIYFFFNFCMGTLKNVELKIKWDFSRTFLELGTFSMFKTEISWHLQNLLNKLKYDFSNTSVPISNYKHFSKKKKSWYLSTDFSASLMYFCETFLGSHWFFSFCSAILIYSKLNLFLWKKLNIKNIFTLRDYRQHGPEKCPSTHKANLLFAQRQFLQKNR